MAKYSFHYAKRFELECGAVLPELDITYHTYGRLTEKMDNIIWVCHALTANSEVDSWWPNTVEEGRFLDPNRYFVICANIIGSHYGSTGPLSVNPITKVPYYGSFPQITVKDVVNAHKLLARELGIKKVKALIGSSIGGFQVGEWIISEPNFAEKAVIIASAARSDAWVVAFNESQRMAIASDPTYGERRDDAALTGMAAARSIALLSYRSRSGYIATQSEKGIDLDKTGDYRASSYQRYQGEKLKKRFNAYSYYRLSELVDSHNLARGRASMEGALASIRSKVALISISSDIIYPISNHAFMHSHIKDSKHFVIESEFGHDGFLVESDKIDNIVNGFIEQN